MHKTIRISCLVVVMILAACSSSKSPQNVPAPLVEIKQSMPIKMIWSAEVGSSDDYIFTPAFVENSIVAAAADGKIIRINNSDGQQLWAVEAELPLTAGVGAGSSTIVVAGAKGVLLAYDLEGKLRWKTQTSSEVLTTPVVSSGMVVVRSIDNHIEAYDAETGKRRWVLERTLPPLVLRNAAGMIIAEGTVFVGLPGGKLVAIALNNGSVRWEATVGEPHGATELERVSDVAGAPVLIGSDICAGAYQGSVACFDVRTGSVRWSKKLSTDVGVNMDGRFVFAADDKGVVNAFSRSQGLSEWKNNQLAYRCLSAPISYGQAVVMADMRGYVHFLSREDGSYLARMSTDGSPVVAAPIVAGSNLIFQTKLGKVVAFALE